MEFSKLSFIDPRVLDKYIQEKGITEIEKDKIFCELHHSVPLMLSIALLTGKAMIIGKVMDENNPFDVIIMEEKDYEETKNVGRPDIPKTATLIQLKRIISHNTKKLLSVKEWKEMVQKNYIDKIKVKYSMKPFGTLYFINQVLFDVSTLQQINDALNALVFEDGFPFKQVIISFSSKDNGDIKSKAQFWQIHPKAHFVHSILDEKDRQRLKEIYKL